MSAIYELSVLIEMSVLLYFTAHFHSGYESSVHVRAFHHMG